MPTTYSRRRRIPAETRVKRGIQLTGNVKGMKQVKIGNMIVFAKNKADEIRIRKKFADRAEKEMRELKMKSYPVSKRLKEFHSKKIKDRLAETKEMLI